jgi:hypothetical protein
MIITPLIEPHYGSLSFMDHLGGRPGISKASLTEHYRKIYGYFGWSSFINYARLCDGFFFFLYLRSSEDKNRGCGQDGLLY